MMRDYPKNVKRALRTLASMAYEEEMKRAVGSLAVSFDEWRAGKIDVWELDQRIHKYHNGPARELHNLYNEPSQTDMLVAYAIVRGVLDQESVPAEVVPYLQQQVAFYRAIEERDQEAGYEEG